MKFIIGLVCIMVWILENIFVTTHNCIVDYSAGEVKIDCEKKIISGTLPGDLDFDAITLDISGNDLCVFSRQNFSKYKHLITLVMTDLKCTPPGSTAPSGSVKLHNNSFVDLMSLEKLDISNSPIEFHPNFTPRDWPKNLKLLKLNNVSSVVFNFSGLEKLEILVAADCDQYKFPVFHPTAPLYFVDLRDNLISDIKVEDVANYCLLGNLLMNIMLYDYERDEHIIQKPPYDDFHCMCLRLKTWVQVKDIYGLEYMECFTKSKDNTSIISPSTLQKPCNGSFQIAKKMYNACWDRKYLHESIIFYINVFLAIIFTALMIGGVSYYLRKTFSIYEGSRHEVIHDPNALDNTSSYYETISGSEVESMKTNSPSISTKHPT